MRIAQGRKITKKDETPEFIAFWELWRQQARHTDGRGLARDTFFKHVEQGADPQDIVDGARWFLRNLKDPAFIPMSATWLNRGAYEDMAEHERTYQARLEASQQKNDQANVVQMRAVLPETHFSKKWEAMQAQKKEAM